MWTTLEYVQGISGLKSLQSMFGNYVVNTGEHRVEIVYTCDVLHKRNLIMFHYWCIPNNNNNCNALQLYSTFFILYKI